MARDKDYTELIHTARWLRLRRWKLTAFPLCERCAAAGRVEGATEVHHRRPVETGRGRREKEALMYDAANLQSLCHRCHVEAHREMGRSGKRLTKEREAAKLEDFKRKFLE